MASHRTRPAFSQEICYDTCKNTLPGDFDDCMGACEEADGMKVFPCVRFGLSEPQRVFELVVPPRPPPRETPWTLGWKAVCAAWPR